MKDKDSNVYIAIEVVCIVTLVAFLLICYINLFELYYASIS